jgi:hypothetical protein
MSMHHHRRDILVSQQFLNSTNIMAAFQQMGGKEWRKVWQLAALVIPARRIASLTAFCKFLSLGAGFFSPNRIMLGAQLPAHAIMPMKRRKRKRVDPAAAGPTRLWC